MARRGRRRGGRARRGLGADRRAACWRATPPPPRRWNAATGRRALRAQAGARRPVRADRAARRGCIGARGLGEPFRRPAVLAEPRLCRVRAAREVPRKAPICGRAPRPAPLEAPRKAGAAGAGGDRSASSRPPRRWRRMRGGRAGLDSLAGWNAHALERGSACRCAGRGDRGLTIAVIARAWRGGADDARAQAIETLMESFEQTRRRPRNEGIGRRQGETGAPSRWCPGALSWMEGVPFLQAVPQGRRARQLLLSDWQGRRPSKPPPKGLRPLENRSFNTAHETRLEGFGASPRPTPEDGGPGGMATCVWLGGAAPLQLQ